MIGITNVKTRYFFSIILKNTVQYLEIVEKCLVRICDLKNDLMLITNKTKYKKKQIAFLNSGSRKFNIFLNIFLYEKWIYSIDSNQLSASVYHFADMSFVQYLSSSIDRLTQIPHNEVVRFNEAIKSVSGRKKLKPNGNTSPKQKLILNAFKCWYLFM